MLNARGSVEPNSNGWVRINCPVCVERTGKADRKESFGYNPSLGRYSCFKCDVWGVFDTDPWSIASKDRSTDTEEFQPPGDFVELGFGAGLGARSFEPARRYLLSRGIAERVWAACGIGACLSGPYAGRIIVPILDNDTWVGFVSRIWGKPRSNILTYKYPKDMERRLFRDYLIDVDTDDPVMVVEGVFDALPYDNAVACLGKPTHAQVERLLNANRPVAMCLDGDAWHSAWQVAGLLGMLGKRAGYVRLRTGDDPSSADHEWMADAARRCVVDGVVQDDRIRNI